MPNWVYNYVDVDGSPEDLEAFKKHLDEFESPFLKEEDKDGFSFHMFITPPADRVEEYHGTHGFVKGERVGDTEYNWYEWNTSKWHTKWDACSVNIEEAPDNSLNISFETAWSPPIPVFKAMTAQFPNLKFDFSWEEEQEWGGEATGRNGVFNIVQEWDIPTSHEDYTSRGRECGNCCGYYQDDPNEWYNDCPDKELEIRKLNMSKQTINITGTDINVGEAVEAIIDGEVNLPIDYTYVSADMYGVGDNVRQVSADVVIETGLEQSDLDGMRKQFPAVDVELRS